MTTAILNSANARPETAAQAVQAYGLDWHVDLAPVQALTPAPRPVPRTRALVRADTGEPLSIVGRRYRPIQNAEAFGLFDAVLAKFGASYVGAGSCDGGRRVWIQAQLPGGMWITKDDEVERFLLLHMLHGGGSLSLVDTPIRVWCRNTLLRALEEGKHRRVRICHRGDVVAQAAAAERTLEASMAGFEAFEREAQAFAGRQIRNEALAAYFRSLVPDPKDGDPSRAESTRADLLRLFETGKGNALPSVRGTLWAAVNAIAEFTDHERSTRSAAGDDVRARRWTSAQFGTGAALKARAWREALALLNS
jgi:phage/plasmid-like protein (TIGR03299 family)